MCVTVLVLVLFLTTTLIERAMYKGKKWLISGGKRERLQQRAKVLFFAPEKNVKKLMKTIKKAH